MRSARRCKQRFPSILGRDTENVEDRRVAKLFLSSFAGFPLVDVLQAFP